MANREQVANYSLFALPRSRKERSLSLSEQYGVSRAYINQLKRGQGRRFPVPGNEWSLDDSGEDVGYEYTSEKIARELEACDSHEKMED